MPLNIYNLIIPIPIKKMKIFTKNYSKAKFLIQCKKKNFIVKMF